MNQYDDQQICDCCSDPISGESIDIMISTTQYDKNHEIKGTMEKAPDGIKGEYYVYCRGCEVHIVNAWNNLVDSMNGQ